MLTGGICLIFACRLLVGAGHPVQDREGLVQVPDREGDPLSTKYVYVTHSELNAILNYRGGSLEGAKLYVSMFPCNECAKAIIQSGIKEIIYDCDKYADTPSVIASKRMLDAAGVHYRQYIASGRKICFDV